MELKNFSGCIIYSLCTKCFSNYSPFAATVIFASPNKPLLLEALQVYTTSCCVACTIRVAPSFDWFDQYHVM